MSKYLVIFSCLLSLINSNCNNRSFALDEKDDLKVVVTTMQQYSMNSLKETIDSTNVKMNDIKKEFSNLENNISKLKDKFKTRGTKK